jgi:signal transduction histidine kinase
MLSSLRTVSSAREPLAARLQAVAAEETAVNMNAPRVGIEISGAPRELRDRVDEDVFLICSEAIKNAFRHSNARQIAVSIQFGPTELQISIEDDGVGIPPRIRALGLEGHFGLRGMRERAARHAGVLCIDCPEAGGTGVSVSVPADRAYIP